MRESIDQAMSHLKEHVGLQQPSIHMGSLTRPFCFMMSFSSSRSRGAVVAGFVGGWATVLP